MRDKKLKEYPKEIRDRVKELVKNLYSKECSLATQFYLIDSEEGFDFWSKINDGDYSDFYKRYPKKNTGDNNAKSFLDEFVGNIKVNEPEVLKFDKLNNDSIVEKVVKSFYERSDVGFKKYGTNLDRKDLSVLEWLNHLQQELQDGILYAEKLKEELSEEEKQTSYPLLKVEEVFIKTPFGSMKFGVNEVSLNYSLDGKTVTLDIK